MNRLPAFPATYDQAWGNTYTRTLEINFNQLSQPISTGWYVSVTSPTRTLQPTSAVGQVGNVAVSINGSANISIPVTGVGGSYNGTLQSTNDVLETLISDMKTRGLLA
jgi:hypothetical protein